MNHDSLYNSANADLNDTAILALLQDETEGEAAYETLPRRTCRVMDEESQPDPPPPPPGS